MDLPFLFLKDRFQFKLIASPVLLILAGFLLVSIRGCSVERVQNHSGNVKADKQLMNSPMVRGQVVPPDNIKSIQLYRGNAKQSVPGIVLQGNQQLTLRFDELGNDPRMFRVRVHHRNADWSDSRLMTDFFLQGHREDIISGGQPSEVQKPDYIHYRYQFPNSNFQFRMSGNYLLEVMDYEHSNTLFSVPFFVVENAGQMDFEFEELFGLDHRIPVHHQPFIRYRYPSFVISPVTDLQLFFVQNRFWGRSIKADEEDMSEAGVYRAYLSRQYAYPGVYEFRPLDLRRYDEHGPDVFEVRPATIPPQVRLQRDVVNLDVNPRRRNPAIHGSPRNDRQARYADVRFELEIPVREGTDLPIYVYGPFNNWTINENNRMEYMEDTDSYRGRAIIKEGEYDYKYAVVEDGSIDDLRLDASFASTAQEYTSFIYFRDPAFQVDRLLQMQTERVH